MDEIYGIKCEFCCFECRIFVEILVEELLLNILFIRFLEGLKIKNLECIRLFVRYGEYGYNESFFLK